MVVKEKWGSFQDRDVYLYKVEDEYGTLYLSEFGAAIGGLDVINKDGKPLSVILGYDTLEEYINGTSFQGATIGRYANRIKDGFELYDTYYPLYKNNGLCNLHGADNSGGGFDKKVWQSEIPCYDDDGNLPMDNAVTFRLLSPDKGNESEGFPGNLDVAVKYTWLFGHLTIEYTAVTDAPTPVNLTNHSYFNLAGNPAVSVANTTLRIKADKYTPVDEDGVPLGEHASVENTVFDLRKGSPIGDCVNKGLPHGYDHNFVLSETAPKRIEYGGNGGPSAYYFLESAQAYCPESGLTMTVCTDMPGVQVYTACNLNEKIRSVDCGLFSAFCLETQFAPNTPNMAGVGGYPSCTLRPGEKYHYTTIYAFSKD